MIAVCDGKWGGAVAMEPTPSNVISPADLTQSLHNCGSYIVPIHGAYVPFSACSAALDWSETRAPASLLDDHHIFPHEIAVLFASPISRHTQIGDSWPYPMNSPLNSVKSVQSAKFHMDVSWNRGSSKSSILDSDSPSPFVNHPAMGVPPFVETHGNPHIFPFRFPQFVRHPADMFPKAQAPKAWRTSRRLRPTTSLPGAGQVAMFLLCKAMNQLLRLLFARVCCWFTTSHSIFGSEMFRSSS